MIESGVTFIDPSHAYISAEAEIGRDYGHLSERHDRRKDDHRRRLCDSFGSAHHQLASRRRGDGQRSFDHRRFSDRVELCCRTVCASAHERGAEKKATVGNFVEVKKSRLKRGTKAMHLTYLEMRRSASAQTSAPAQLRVTTTASNKHETIIEDDVKVGSDTMLVRAVRSARVRDGAGSVVTKDVPPDSLVAGVPRE
jgi:bifunctional UDP-N-acetylglucosamine pyrophosphorylase/glucosamine-1-phosphate N-acetyltransferase